MLGTVGIILSIAVALPLTCDNTNCNQEYLGDYDCDLECNNPFCLYDSGLDNTYSKSELFEYSDCFEDCYDSDCDVEGLGDGTCNDDCNTAECAFDLGDCGICTDKACTQELLSNEVCDQVCNVESCSFDMGACGKCAPGCTKANLNSNICIDACRVDECLYEMVNPCISFCAPGCFPSYLADGYCDSSCNNEACEYDKGDCVCSPGCTNEKMNENGCPGLAANPCNTEECNYKDGKCGDCMPNCFENMLGDGICDPQCNYYKCDFDYGDCGCSPGCSMIYNAVDSSWKNQADNVDNINCLTPYCNYNMQNSPAVEIIKIAVLNEIINKNLSIVNFVAPASCTIDMIKQFSDQSQSTCLKSHACNTKTALYCAGRVESILTGCLRTDGTNCLVCTGTMVMGVCTPALSTCPSGYHLEADLSALFDYSTLSTSICLRDFAPYSITSPKISYVMPDPSGPSSTGAGTAADPYKSLYFAMTQQYATFSKIILKEGIHIFQVDDSLTLPLIPDTNDPLNTKLLTTMYYLSIEGENPLIKSVISWRGMLKITQRTKKMYFKNIIFEGKSILMNNCTGTTDFCYYCPYINATSKVPADDREKPILQDLLYNTAKNCSLYNSHILFSLSINSYFENVEFNDFRHQFKNLIISSGSISLKNVKFSKIQVATGEEAIKLVCSVNCNKTVIEFIDSSVTDFNYGYEHTDEIELGSFFTAQNFETAIISNVKFTFNFVLSYLESIYKNWLLSFKDFTGTLTITDCLFDTNYVNSLILIDTQNLKYKNYNPDYKGVSIAYSQVHFTLKNTIFQNIYSSDDFLAYSMKSTVQNFLISNVKITNVQCGGSGIISIQNLGKMVKRDTVGSMVKVTIGGKKQKVQVLPRQMNITDLEVSNSVSGDAVLNLLQLSNINMTKIKIFNVNDGVDNIVNSTIEFFRKASKYFSKVPSNEDVAELSCSQITNIQQSYSVIVNTFEIYNTSCEVHDGASGLIINGVLRNAELENINIHDISSTDEASIDSKGSTEPNAIYVNLCIGEVSLSHIKITEVYNSDAYVIQISNSIFVEIFDLVISSVFSKNNSPFSIANFNALIMKSFSIIDSSTENSNGGCIELIASGKVDSSIDLESGYLKNCNSELGNGGGIFLDSSTSSFYQALRIFDVQFISNEAMYGSAFYISQKISLNEDAIIHKVSITENLSVDGGIISDNHLEGTLFLKDFVLMNNQGETSGIEGSYSSERSLLTIENISVIKSKGNNVFSFKSKSSYPSLVNMTSVALHDNLDYEGKLPGNGFDLTAIDIILQNLVMYNMSTIMKANGYNIINITNSKFWDIKTSGFLLVSNTNLSCSNCELYTINGSVFTANDQSAIFLNFTKIYKNHVLIQETSLVSIELGLIPSIFTNSLFYDNSNHLGYLFQFSNTKNIIISNCTFRNNLATVAPFSGLYFYKSVATIDRSVFDSQKSVNFAAFIYAVTNSLVNIVSSRFSNGSAEQAGAIYLADSTLSISSSVFSQNSATSLGGAIFAKRTPVIIHNCTFTSNSGNKGGDIYMIDRTLSIVSSAFSLSNTPKGDSTGAIDFGGLCTLYVETTTFSSLTKGTSALAIYNASAITIKSSSFFNISSIGYGAALFIGNQANGNVTISNSKFLYNNSTGNGSAFYSEDMGVNIIDTQISYNYAKISGGGIYLSTPYCKLCTFNIKGKTNITENSCDGEGGAMKWLDYKPNIDVTVNISNNTAVYGANLASKPANLRGKKKQRYLVAADEIIFDGVPGQVYTNSLLISIYDTYGTVVVSDNESILRIESLKNDKVFSLADTIEFTAKKGVFNVTGFTPIGTPGSIQRFRAYDQSMVTTAVANDDTVYDNSILIEINLRNCTYGEIIGVSSCIRCVEHKFLIGPDYVCKSCPDGGICPGGSDIYLEPGYYRGSNESEIVYKCPQTVACLGNETGWITPCKEGYYSVKCAGCTGGYNKASEGACSLCPSDAQNGFILFIILVGIIIVCVILVKSSIKSAFTPKAKHSIYIKIFTNYIQLVAITAQFELKWPSYVTSLFGVQKSTASASDTIFSLDCFVASKNSGDPVNSYYYKLTMMALLPIFIFLISALVWLFICFAKEKYSYMKRELFLTMIVIFFLVYPNITKMMFSHFSCENIDGLGYYLMENYGIECWNSTHTQYAFIVAIPGLIVWSIGLPTAILVVMAKRKRYLNRENNKVIFGFIYNGYRMSRFFWEFIIVYRKILMVCVVVFVSRISIPVQGLTVTFVLAIALFLQYELRPYNSDELNNLEVEALITATLTIYCGLYYLTEDINEAFKLVLFLIIVAGNAYFIILWIYWMLAAISEMIAKSSPTFRLLFKKGDALDGETSQEKLSNVGRFFNHDEGENTYTFVGLPQEGKSEFNLKTMNDLFQAVYEVNNLEFQK